MSVKKSIMLFKNNERNLYFLKIDINKMIDFFKFISLWVVWYCIPIDILKMLKVQYFMPFMVRCHRNTNAIFVIFHFFIIYYQYSQKCESFFSICDFCTFLKKIILVTDSFSSIVGSTRYKIYIIYLINKHCL